MMNGAGRSRERLPSFLVFMMLTPQKFSRASFEKSNRATVAWCVERGLLNVSEARNMDGALRLPPQFADRVLERYQAATPSSVHPNIRSDIIIPSEESQAIPPPVMTVDGPVPERLRDQQSTTRIINLHHATTGRLFLGLRQKTLILNEKNFFEEVSTPASPWITPVFAAAPGQLHIDGTVAVLYTDGAALFSHWMFDLLPKLEVLLRAGWVDDRVDYYLVNSLSKKFQPDSLKTLQIAKAKVIAVANHVVTADAFVIPSSIRSGFNTPRWVRDFVRKTFAPASAESGHERKVKRIYISRAKTRRKIRNEAEVRGLLESKRFQTVFAEEISTMQMAGLVENCECIIAPHGAGVMNVAFASPHIRLLETYGPHLAPEGWKMTNAIGGTHYLLPGKDEQGRYPWQDGAFEGTNRQFADYTIEIADLERALQQMSVC